MYVVDDLKEANLGDIEGKTIAEVDVEEMKLWKSWIDSNFGFKNGETKLEIKDRAVKTLCELAKDSTESIIGISTHGAFISCLFYEFGLEVDYNLPKGVPFHLVFENGELKLAEDFKI